MNRILIFLLLGLIALPSVAVAQETTESDPYAETIVALKNLQTLDQRLHVVGYRLIAANRSYCNESTRKIGVMFHDIEQYGDKIAAQRAFGFSRPITVNSVAPNSPATSAGIMTGDGLIAIDGILVEDTPVRKEILTIEKPVYQRLANVLALLKDSLSHGNASLLIERGDTTRTVNVHPVSTCTTRFQIRVDDNRNASADGKIVSISSTLAEYTHNDDELAAIAAHELAHNLLKHRERLNKAKVNRGFFGQFGKSAKKIKQTEIEADRLSVWLMANAGYNPQAAIGFWTRYGKQYGKGIFSASTHYRWKKRVKLFDEELEKMEEVNPVDGKREPPLLHSPET